MDTIQRTSIISFPGLGITGLNPPASFEIFGKTIYFYGVLIAIGFLAGIWYCSKSAKKYRLAEDDVYDAVIWMIPAAIIGARIYYVLFRLDYYLAHPDEIIAVWEGGLAIYGGVILSILVIWIVCRKKKIHFAAMIDCLVSGLLIGQIIGRWGNFMNREAFGAETEIFCRMGLTNTAGVTIYVHPTFLYESLWNLIGFIYITVFVNKGKRRWDGQIFCMYLLWYGIGRAWIEGLRSDSLYIGNTGIRVSQLLSVCLAIFGAIMLYVNRKKSFSEEIAEEEQTDSVPEEPEISVVSDSDSENAE